MKTIGIILLVIIGGIGLFICLLYATVKAKTTSLNQYQPFNEWIGKTVKLNKEVVLFKDKISTNKNYDYPFIMLDSLHPKWKYVEERTTMAEPDLEMIVKLSVGTILKFDKAIQYTNGVSGSSYPTIFGIITTKSREYKIGYQWGNIDIGKKYDKVEKCWHFHQAPWQEKQDTAFYALPIANFW